MFGAIIAVSRLHARVAPNGDSFPLSRIFKQYFSRGLSHSGLSQSIQGFRYIGSWRSFSSSRSWSCKNDTFGWNHRNRQILSMRPNILQFCTKANANPLTVKTNIRNNVMLYRFEKPYMYKCAAAFSVLALVGCLAMADNVYLILCKDLFDQKIDLSTRILGHLVPISAIIVGVLGGPTIMYTVWYVTVRTIKYLILRKGGQEITVVTYHPFKGEVNMTVPLRHVSCTAGRTENKGYIPLKIKHTKFNYMIDKAGYFVNPELFDGTVAVKRF